MNKSYWRQGKRKLRELVVPGTRDRRAGKLGGRAVPRLEELESRLAPATLLSINNSSAVEPGPGGTANIDFTVTRSGDPTSQITVGYTTVAGTAQPNTDFKPSSGTTTFASGSATATISIPIFGNGVYNNPSLTFSVKLTGIINVVGPPVTLADQSTFATGTGPVSVAIADFNGDGKPDLALAHYGADAVSVLLNTTPPGSAAPSFAAAQEFPAGPSPDYLAAGDLNGDGKPDLVLANEGSNSVSVLLNATAPGAAMASFANHVDFTTGEKPVSVAIADLNGDGRPDLAVANKYSNSVSVLMNTSAPGATIPSFAAKQDFTMAQSPMSLAIADLNGDGKPDVAVATADSRSVSVLLNTTAPGAALFAFAPHSDFATGDFHDSIAIGDLNDDGKPDIVVANNFANSVSVLLNTTPTGAATPSFAPKQDFPTGTRPASVAIGDLNGDGKPDLVVANSGDNFSVLVLSNTTASGAATTSFAENSGATGPVPLSVAIGDLNGDGKPDLAVADFSSNNVSVLLNTTVLPAPTIVPDFPQAASLESAGAPGFVAIGDLNGDGKPDLAIANIFNTNGVYSVSVYLNTTAPGATTATFAPRVDFPTASLGRSVAIADLNGDGKPDLVFVNVESSSLSVLLNTMAPGATRPSFAPKVDFPIGGAPMYVAIGDLNGDGRPDLVVSNELTQGLSVLLNTTAPGASTPSFASQVLFGSAATSVGLGDLNGDGRPDLVFVNNGPNTVSVLLNTTAPGADTPSFSAKQDFAVSNPFFVVLADLNGDGRLDLVVSKPDSGGVSVLLNTTAPGANVASFGPEQDFATGSFVLSLAIGDLNGDGKPDLAVANSNSGTVSVLLNTTPPGSAAVSFSPKVDLTTGSFPGPVAIGDLNGDGRPDLAVGTNMVAILLNTPAEIAGKTATGTIIESDTTITSADHATFVVGQLGTFTVTAAGMPTPSLSETGALPAGVTFVDNHNGTATLSGMPAPGTAGIYPLTITAANRVGASATQNFILTVKQITTQSFLNHVYLDLLGRPIDASGLAVWGGLLDRGVNRFVVVVSIENSLEYRSAQVQSLYQHYLHRAADSLGLADGIRFLQQGGTVEQLSALLISSQEYFLSRAGGSVDGLLSSLFQDALGRPIDAAARTNDGFLLSSGLTSNALALAVLTSPEGQTRLVGNMYLQFLHRPADPAGLNAFVHELAQGARDELIIASMLASDEYLSRAF